MPEQQQFHLYTHQLDSEQTTILQRALEHFHEAQDLLKIAVVGESALPVENNQALWYELVEQVQPEVPTFYITGLKIEDNWFSHTWCNLTLISAVDWTLAFEVWNGAPPLAAPDAYLLHELTTAALLASVCLREENVAHDATTGCMADMCSYKPDIGIKLRSGFLCPECRQHAAEAGLSGVYLDAVQALLDRIRLLALGRPPQPQMPHVVPENEILKFIQNAETPHGFVIPQPLVEALRERNLTVLVGSGFSLQPDIKVEYEDSLQWQTLPGWTEIGERLSQRSTAYLGYPTPPRQTLTLQEFLTDLDFVRERLSPDRYYPRAISDIFLPQVHSTGIANRLLFHLPLKWLLTTNYDFILNYAAPAGTATFTWKEAKQAGEYLLNANVVAPILKLHGCASRTDTVILTALEYERLAQVREYKSLTHRIFENQTVLFLGYGLNDPLDLDMALNAANNSGAAQGPKFALIHKKSAQAIRDKHPNVQVLSYEDHDDIPRLLAMLIKKAQR